MSIIPAKRSFKVGEPIEVTLLLEAGGRGVYLAKGWGGAGGGIPGFFVEIETLSGRGAQTCGFAADGLPTTDQDATTLLREHFVFVAPSQIVGWKTNVVCPPKRRGRYRVVASYSPGLPGTKDAARLPEAKGVVLTKSIHAKPFEIDLR